MGPYVWCAVGAVMGWVASRMMSPPGFVAMVEAICVGIFGTFLGGEFLPAMVLATSAEPRGLSAVTVSMAVVTAAACLMLLVAMRRSVGPLKSGKRRK